ncbi:hypothetical protein FB45DRAFT_1017522 [Roridomyces roridus]|uniref:Uncharacterized protein n=1 Tax=Roridomyces roridus TaxID=1738132 RepID=A0AAD7CIS4_9AGAR|nr:hypothetical protein FB45DRAFT_1017522 [Roridomyces roridus]
MSTKITGHPNQPFATKQKYTENTSSREAQLRDIEASFAACHDEFSLAELRHPNKPNYNLFRFSERPGERPLEVDDPRLDCAILRPMKTEHDSFLSYYLTTDDESALKFKANRRALAPYEVSAEDGDTIFNFVRDYETVKVEQEGAYYKNIERKILLKKKRVNVRLLRFFSYIHE